MVVAVFGIERVPPPFRVAPPELLEDVQDDITTRERPYPRGIDPGPIDINGPLADRVRVLLALRTQGCVQTVGFFDVRILACQEVPERRGRAIGMAPEWIPVGGTDQPFFALRILNDGDGDGDGDGEITTVVGSRSGSGSGSGL